MLTVKGKWVTLECRNLGKSEAINKVQQEEPDIASDTPATDPWLASGYEKTLDKPTLRDTPQHNWPVIL